MNPRQPADVFEFKGAAVLSNTIIATEAAAVIETGSDFDTVQLECTDHGYLAGSLIYLSGFIAPLTYLNGLKVIYAVATNTFDVKVKPGKFVVGTPEGSEVARTVATLDEDFEFIGFNMHMDAVSTTSENLLIQKDAAKGEEFDVIYYDRDLDGIDPPDIVYAFDDPLQCKAGDLIVATYPNTDDATYGLTLKLRRLS